MIITLYKTFINQELYEFPDNKFQMILYVLAWYSFIVVPVVNLSMSLWTNLIKIKLIYVIGARKQKHRPWTLIILTVNIEKSNNST